MGTKFDVIVVGGGAAGAAAATASARMGARTALVERYGFLGGAATNASVSTLDGYFDQTGRQVVGGVGGEVLEILRQRRAAEPLFLPRTGNTVVPFDRETLKLVLDDLVSGAGATALLHGQLVAAEGGARRVDAVRVAHRGGLEEMTATCFVDCSGDGALLHAAGAGCTISPLDERQRATLVAVVAGVGPDAEYARPALARAVAAHNDDTGDDLTTGAAFALFNRFTGDAMLFVGDEKFDALDLAAISAAERRARHTIAATVSALRAHLPGWQDAHVTLTGPQIGLREVRRLAGRHRVTAEEAAAGTIPDDTIALAGWPIEDHSGDTPRYVPIRGRGAFGVPLDALVSATHDNLWAAGRLVSSDTGAFCSLRVMATGFATGQAAGVAAALAASGRAPTPVNTRAILAPDAIL